MRSSIFVFGAFDQLTPTIDRWKTDFSDPTYLELPEVGHYIQEEAPDEVIDAIRSRFDSDS